MLVHAGMHVKVRFVAKTVSVRSGVVHPFFGLVAVADAFLQIGGITLTVPWGNVFVVAVTKESQGNTKCQPGRSHRHFCRDRVLSM